MPHIKTMQCQAKAFPLRMNHATAMRKIQRAEGLSVEVGALGLYNNVNQLIDDLSSKL